MRAVGAAHVGDLIGVGLERYRGRGDCCLVVVVQRIAKLREVGEDAFGFDGIDVFAPPGIPPRRPLLELDNVLLTPHCAGSSVESTYDSKVRGARNAADVLLGKWPAFVVNPEVVPRWPLAPPRP